ncbi:TorF family putative porin [Roseateles sp. GG27B]
MPSTARLFSAQRTAVLLPISLCLLSLHLGAQAEGLEPEQSISYNVGALTDYRVRGIAQTSFKPALQGGIDFADKSGFYAGLFGSNVNWVKEFNGATQGSVELDLYGGYKGTMDALPLSYDVGLITYQYLGNNSGVGGVLPAGTFANANTVEVYGSVSYKIYTLKINRSVGNFLGNLSSSGSMYYDFSAAVDLGNSLSLTPHIGHQTISNQTDNLGNYTDLSLTLAKDFGNGVVASVAAITTNANRVFYTDTNGRYLGKDALVVGLKYNF